jgi:hypothetical protein
MPNRERLRSLSVTMTGLPCHAPAPFTPRAQTTAGFNLMVSSRTSENPARIRATAISRPWPQTSRP